MLKKKKNTTSEKGHFSSTEMPYSTDKIIWSKIFTRIVRSYEILFQGLSAWLSSIFAKNGHGEQKMKRSSNMVLVPGGRCLQKEFCTTECSLPFARSTVRGKKTQVHNQNKNYIFKVICFASNQLRFSSSIPKERWDRNVSRGRKFISFHIKFMQRLGD